MKIVDWFIPHTPMHDRAELGRARIFVFSHLVGPTFSQAISAFLFFTDPSPGFACWIIVCGICVFWTLPFILRLTNEATPQTDEVYSGCRGRDRLKGLSGPG